MIHIRQLDKSAVIDWLQARGERQLELFRQARAVRSEHRGDEVLLRGVIEISNHCEKSCKYCAMRHQNGSLARYRMSTEEILAVAVHIRSQGISTAFLQAGQDRESDAILEQVIPEIKGGLGMNVLLCVGERPEAVYRRFAELGADAYILKYETANAALYRQIASVTPEPRLRCLAALRAAGLKIGTGNIVGLPGQTLEDIADDFLLALALHPDFVSAAPFIPNEGTPLAQFPVGDLDLTLNLMALWRIALPDALIPAVSALEKIRPGGQLTGMNAGANVLTINFTPEDCRAKYAIYSEQRFVVSLRHALETVRRAGLRVRAEQPELSAA
jgi:biotin synthase